MININFDHNNGSMLASIGATKEDFDNAISKVLYFTMSRPFVVKDLYGVDILLDDDDSMVPKSLMAKSSVLENSLQKAANEHEQLLILMLFEKQYDVAREMLALYTGYRRMDDIKQMLADREELPLELMLKMEIFKHKMKHISELDEMFEYISASSGNYDIFKSLVPSESPVNYLLGKLKGILKLIDSKSGDDYDIDDE